MKRDELIMRHYDGELEAEHAAEVEQALASDPSMRAELAGLQVLGRVVRDVRPLPDIDVAASIFDRLGLPDPSEAKVAATASRSEGSSIRRPVRSRPPRTIRPGLALAGVSSALAMAAGVALWLAHPAPSHEPTLAASSSGLRSQGPDAPEIAEIAAPAPAISVPEPEPPVESVAVERVDFGSSEGAIFLVPNADDRTLVVWTLDELADDDEGEEADL